MFKMTDKKKVDRYFSINTDESNKIEIGHFDLDFKSQLKQQGREERFAHWSEIFKTISSIQPDIVTSLLPLMLKDTDSQIIEDIEEVLANADKAQEEANKVNQPISQKMQEPEMAKLQAQIEKLQKESQKLESQSKVMGQMQEQMKQEANNPQNSTTQSDAQKMAKKTMQISVKDMR